MVSSGLLRRAALVRTDVSEVIRVTKIGVLGTTQATTSNRHTEPHGITTQKTPFFIVTTMKTSNLTTYQYFTVSHKSNMQFKESILLLATSYARI
jgi:hypothetical protein